jgi:hypothetical protein
MAFEIIDVLDHDCDLCVCVNHFHADGSFWFRENYLWQGREGLRCRIALNADGEPLLSDDSVAPMSDASGYYCPSGMAWKRTSEIYLDVETSILEMIRSTHSRRLLAGWPQGTIDQVPPKQQRSSEDESGCSVLIAKFASLKGTTYGS